VLNDANYFRPLCAQTSTAEVHAFEKQICLL
jgi:hypothetical protein